MKLLLITLLTFSSFAQESTANQKDPTKEKLIVSDIKKTEIEDSLKGNQDIIDCKKDSNPQACISKIIETLDEKQLEAISKDLGESAFKVEGGARSESIKNFMQERISKIVYGDKKTGDDTNPPKVVGHEAYREIYKSQLGKNMLLDINTYCLENIGSSNPNSILNVTLDSNGKTSSFGYSEVKDDKKIESFNPETDIYDLVRTTYEYRRGDKSLANKDGSSTRDTPTLKVLKKASLSLYQNNGVGAEAGNLCRSYIIPLMCERYKCSSTKKASMSDSEIETCKNKLKVNYNAKDKNGQIACSLVSKLESYKKTFVGLKAQKDFFDKANQNLAFESVADSTTVDYDKIDEATSIGSKELSNEVESLKNLDEDVKKIEDECLQGDNESEFCKGLASSISDEDQDSAIFENELADAVYAKKVDLASSTTEDLTKFLEENNLLEKYKDKIDTINPDQLAKIIKNDYAVKKDALNDTMMAKLEAIRGTKSADSDNYNETQTIQNKKSNLENDKEYIETMFEYNNIVTSYLQLSTKGEKEDGSDREVIGSFGQNKKSELAALEKYSLSDEELREYEEYKKMFSDDGSTGSSASKSSMDSVDFIGFLDSVLGAPTENK